MLNELALQRGLTRQDRLAMIKAHKAGLRLPCRKPVIPGPVAAPALSQTTAPAITRPAMRTAEDYPSRARDDSDVEMSDDQLAKELPSLSEEERDLPEYTATMSWPMNREERRKIAPPVNPAIDSLKGANRMAAIAYSVIRNRVAAVSRLVATNHSVSTRTKIPSNIPRPGPTALNRTRRQTTSSRRKNLAHSQSPASRTQATSGPSALKISQAINPECVICYSQIDLDKPIMRQPTSSCRHEVNVCKECLSASISSQLDTKLWTRIGCPASDCEELLEYQDIQVFADPQVFAR